VSPAKPSLADRYFAIEPHLIGGLLAFSGALALYLVIVVGHAAGW
jgi:hypothetical protein